MHNTGRNHLAAGETGRLLAELQRGCADIALPDSDAERVALLPDLLVGFLLPVPRRDQPGMLTRQFDAGQRTQAQLARRFLDLVDAEAARGFIEKDVATVLDGAFHIQGA